ncbi:MAG: hypothetical protein KVP17_002108 [Porospora cf. gigantea B]|uniref:uncharacterized protein n=1 Tax=Porospora cf. gigantea B TaxID=2853592 RepID=UPI003571C6C7|nr:MAG: hypothetical protein KVP17_002108 [Porospora cf. gigantea B]
MPPLDHQESNLSWKQKLRTALTTDLKNGRESLIPETVPEQKKGKFIVEALRENVDSTERELALKELEAAVQVFDDAEALPPAEHLSYKDIVDTDGLGGKPTGPSEAAESVKTPSIVAPAAEASPTGVAFRNDPEVSARLPKRDLRLLERRPPIFRSIHETVLKENLLQNAVLKLVNLEAQKKTSDGLPLNVVQLVLTAEECKLVFKRSNDLNASVTEQEFSRVFQSLLQQQLMLVSSLRSEAAIRKVITRALDVLFIVVYILGVLIILGLKPETIIVSGAAVLTAFTLVLSVFYQDFIQSIILVLFLNPYSVGDVWG